MMEPKPESLSNPVIDFFPKAPAQELQRLQEIVKGKDVTIIPLGNSGYIVHNNLQLLVAEAPWICLDFDDTGAQTTADKSRCWQELGKIGIGEDVIKYCDAISRVDFGEAGVIYEPELEMRLISHALSKRKGDVVKLDPTLTQELEQIRADLIKNKSLQNYPIGASILTLYEQSRYSSTLYPDTINTLEGLKANAERPNNVAIFTYGDPEFQLRKTKELLNAGINQIWLTKTKKGQFFKELLSDNPFRRLPLQYTYDQTERAAGINFKDWQVMIALFDDDPKQVESFNSLATAEGLTGLGVIRVRRSGVKRADEPVNLSRMVGEIHLSDSYLDTHLYQAAINELSARVIEDFLLQMVTIHGDRALVDEQTAHLIGAIADYRGLTFEQARDEFLAMTGLQKVVTLPSDDAGGSVTIWSGD